jgi:O-antigen ligase
MAKNSNRLAYICMFATCLIWFYRCHAHDKKWKIITLPLLFLLPLATLASGSRGGLLQMATLGAAIIRDQKGWSATKRLNCILCLGLTGILLFAVVPSAYIERATNYDTAQDAAGQESLANRSRVVLGALQMIAADPLFGAGFGNYPWVAPTFFRVGGSTHNSYLWAFTSGGIGVFALYLLLFYVTYRMLKQLERSGPRELLWLVKAMKVNVVLFLICSISTDFWLSDFLYLIVGVTVAMIYLPQSQEQLRSAHAPRRPTPLPPIRRFAARPPL